MGIGIVLIFWAIIGLVLATVGAAVLVGLTFLLTRGVKSGRIRAVLFAGLLPFFCLGWAGAVVVVSGVVNEAFFQRDAGIGDSWTTPFPNGYAMLMIDTMDAATVFNPKTQTLRSGVGEQDDAVGDVSILQVTDRAILGRRTGGSYFLIDTRAGTHRDFSSLSALRSAAAPLAVNLRPAEDVYIDYRSTWFDDLALLAILLPPSLGCGLLAWWIARIRRRSKA